MSAGKHSPAPWRYDFEPEYCGEFIAADGQSIATFADEPNEADTRLMVAAPELLTELRIAVAVLKATSGDIQDIQRMQAVLNKATGEQA